MANSINHTRRLAAALIVSGALNIFLLALIFYWAEQERTLASYFGQRLVPEQVQQVPLTAAHQSNSAVIRAFRKMSFAQLKAALADSQLVENGYTHRDLALASLVAFHHFDLGRALSGCAPVQQRRLAYGKYRDGRVAELTVFPGLSEHHYARIVDFAATERWPLTGKGLFATLKQLRGNRPDAIRDTSLSDAFYMTQEFAAVEALFGRSSPAVERYELLDTLLQAEWSALIGFIGQQHALQDPSITRRQLFLQEYVKLGSKSAAYLMLKVDGDFALKRLGDAQVVQLLHLLDEKRAESERFALALLTSPRTDAVWQAASARLYQYAGEAVPEKCHHSAALAKFVPQHAVVPEVQPIASVKEPTATPAAPRVAAPPSQKIASVPAKPLKAPPSLIAKSKDSLYIVQEGDSLWKISRRFNVDIDCLKSHNRLDSDLLKPGKPLRIPKSEKKAKS